MWIKVYYAKLFMSRETSKVFVAGSNANLLSKELGTFLTGRYVTMELYPFSFHHQLIHPESLFSARVSESDKK